MVTTVLVGLQWGDLIEQQKSVQFSPNFREVDQ